ncbi:HD domain-containing protein [Niabella pedocola]|uniref:HD domain-containing protein n=1 Tax=Niabella pedocola TaxID=1752077 RepID=A0ABS8PYI4_9BACT|nr:HD domain-containing protein [Niabella pedocola]MCD2426132.1 HD domain-containing protein [Niabella pedocola]
MANVRKIINDPVYGFITIDHPLLLAIISHPYYQRLRSIHQMAFAHLVYPGAVHTRLLHSLGAYHLMCTALQELKGKGVIITEEEELGAKIAILLHDIGHGPFSHALEHELIPGVHHEKLSLAIMQELNQQFNNQLETALAIFTNQHPKKFLHQLVSGQLDVDRMDYLNRDSFFTGVAEGVIGYDRILKMLAVHQDNLVVEEKAIYSIEKFLLSRRLMYWQVYLHKTVVAAEKMLVMIIRRAKELIAQGVRVTAATDALEYFLLHGAAKTEDRSRLLMDFCSMDDNDMAATIKNWCRHEDRVLSYLCQALVERRIMKIRLQAHPFDEAYLLQTRSEMAAAMGISEKEAAYFVFWGEASNSLYNPKNETITILYKDGQLKDISEVDHALINVKTTIPVKKYYICSFRSH